MDKTAKSSQTTCYSQRHLKLKYRNVFDEMGAYWAEIADKNQTERQIQFLKSQLKPEGYILDLACGSGRHTVALSADGYSVVGLDVSRRLLEIAKQRSPIVDVVLGDMRHLPFQTGVFSTVVSVDNSFGYLPSEQDDRVSMAEVARVLLRNGTFIIDVFNREQLALKYKGETASQKWRDYPSFFLQQKRTVSPNGTWLFDFWTIRDKATDQVLFFEHKARLYTLGQMQGLLGKAGFKIRQVYGGYDDEEFGVDSPRLIFVCGNLR